MGSITKMREPTVSEILSVICCDADKTEEQLRRGLDDIFRRTLPGATFREAGVVGVEFDLYLAHRGVDHIILIRKRGTAQELKILLGEVLLLYTRWDPQGDATRTEVHLVTFGGFSAEGVEHFLPLEDAAAVLQDAKFKIEVVLCPPQNLEVESN